MKNWKTTVGGILAAAGQYLLDQPGWLHIAGQIVSAIGLLLLGAAAQDTANK